MTDTKKAAKPTTGRETPSEGWTDEERAAMKEHNREMKTAAKRGPRTEAEEEAELLAKIAEMSDADRVMGERIHAIVKASAPSLTPSTWYGMPAYKRDGKVVCFYQPAGKFKARYSTLGFNDAATLDDGAMWATSFALTELTPADEKKIAALVEKAAG